MRIGHWLVTGLGVGAVGGFVGGLLRGRSPRGRVGYLAYAPQPFRVRVR